MSSYLYSRSGCTSGTFNTINIGESGKGWGINITTFFKLILNKMSNTSYIIINREIVWVKVKTKPFPTNFKILFKRELLLDQLNTT